MAFSLPVFNLTCDIYTPPWLTRVLRVTSPGNLAFGRRANMNFLDYAQDIGFQGYASLLLPPLTDVMAYPTYPAADVIEIPSGSGRWYRAMWVEDIGKGFDNEHRSVAVAQISSTLDPTLYAGLSWPTPMT